MTKDINGKLDAVLLDSISSISQASLNKKALGAMGIPDIKEKEFTGYNGMVQYDFTFTDKSLMGATLVNGFSTIKNQFLFNHQKTSKFDSLLYKEHERVFNKVKKYLRLKEGTVYVMRISIKFEWDEKNDKAIERSSYLIDKKYQMKELHDKNAKC